MRRSLFLLTALFSASIATTSSQSSLPEDTELDAPKTRPEPIKSEGCNSENAKSLAKPGGASSRIKIGQRHFRLTLPVNYSPDKPAPLIIAFHDYNSSAKKLESESLLSHSNYNKDAVVAYPEAYENAIWMSDPEWPNSVDDIIFTSSLITRLSSNLCIDTDRIYAAGQGTGGGMAHLLACSPDTSSKIAAFALINGNIVMPLKNKIGPDDVKDAMRLLWERCKPSRIGPMRLINIHTENNTVYDYWGSERFKNRRRKGVVRWLVEWAHSNNCGMATEMPAPWKDGWDKVYKTRLSQGYIFEGFVENGTVTKAMYHCWFGDTGEDKIPELNDEEEEEEQPSTSSKWKVGRSTATDASEPSKETDVPIANDESQTTPGEENEVDEFIRQLRDSTVLEHYFVRNAGHGWPRLKRKPESPEDQKEDSETSSDTKTLATWEDVTDPPKEALDLSFDDEAFTFNYGFSDPDPKEIGFDSTERVLNFFRLFRLSDPPPKAPRDEYGLTEVESDVLEKLVINIKKKMAEDDEVEKTKSGDTDTEEDETKVDQETPKEPKSEKDEL